MAGNLSIWMVSREGGGSIRRRRGGLASFRPINAVHLDGEALEPQLLDQFMNALTRQSDR